MSGRPSKLTVWADDTNYPAGSEPWNAQPMKSAPVNFYFTPKEDVPAEYVNYYANRHTRNNAALLNYVGEIPALNWRDQKSEDDLGTAGDYITAITFDPRRRTWLIGKVEGTDSRVLYSWNNGQTWTTYGAVFTHGAGDEAIVSILADDTANFDLYAITQLSATSTKVWKGDGATWTAQLTSATGTPTRGSGHVFKFDAQRFALFGTSNTSAKLFDEAAGTWTDRTATYINTLSSVAGYWAVAQGVGSAGGAGILVAFACGIAAEGRYYRATAAGTWSLISGPTHGTAGVEVRAAAFGQLETGSGLVETGAAVFLMAAVTASGDDTEIYRAFDSGATFGDTFAFAATITNIVPLSLTSLGTSWVLLGHAVASGTETDRVIAYVSTDGGTTWRLLTHALLPDDTSGGGSIHDVFGGPRIVHSDCGFGSVSTTHVRLSFEAGQASL